MGKKAKKKQSKKPTRKGQRNKNSNNREKKEHKPPHWRAGFDDPVRQSVEADGSKTVIDMAADGNCLFRALSDQLFYDYGTNHDLVRSEVCDYLEAYEEEFKLFLVLDDEDEDASDFESYVETMREDGEWGGNLEQVVAARLYRRDIIVFAANLAAITIPHGSSKSSAGPPLLLSYHDNEHYNSVRDHSQSKPPPPIRTYSKPKTLDPPGDKVEDNSGDWTEDNGQSDENDDADINREKENGDKQQNTQEEEDRTEEADATGAPSNSKNQKKPKRSAPCPCGSGLKYSKCCRSKESGEKFASKEGEEESNTTEIAQNGFRMLTI